MSNYILGKDLRLVIAGVRVDRATANLPQTATGSLFTVTGGRVLVTSIVGQVTTVVQTQANNTKLVATPTVGTVNDLCAVLDLTAAAVGSLLSVTGLVSDALVKSTGGAIATQRNGIVVAAGAIGLSCAASNTGQVKWSLTYIPYDDGAAVVAA